MATALCAAGPARAGDGPGAVDFDRDVRPILSETCYQCHGPDPNRRLALSRIGRRPPVGHAAGPLRKKDPHEISPSWGSDRRSVLVPTDRTRARAGHQVVSSRGEDQPGAQDAERRPDDAAAPAVVSREELMLRRAERRKHVTTPPAPPGPAAVAAPDELRRRRDERRAAAGEGREPRNPSAPDDGAFTARSPASPPPDVRGGAAPAGPLPPAPLGHLADGSPPDLSAAPPTPAIIVTSASKSSSPSAASLRHFLRSVVLPLTSVSIRSPRPTTTRAVSTRISWSSSPISAAAPAISVSFNLDHPLVNVVAVKMTSSARTASLLPETRLIAASCDISSPHSWGWAQSTVLCSIVSYQYQFGSMKNWNVGTNSPSSKPATRWNYYVRFASARLSRKR